MRRKGLISALVVCLLSLSPCSMLSGSQHDVTTGFRMTENGPSSPTLSTGAPTPMAPIHSGFVENRGQFPDDAVRFYASAPGGRIALAKGYVLINVEQARGEGPPTMDARSRLAGMLQDASASPSFGGLGMGCTIRLSFEGANDVEPRGVGQLSGYNDYFLGSDPARWRTHVATYQRIVYEGIYEGIDLVYSLGPLGAKYEFVVSPGADPGRIRLRAEGQDAIAIRPSDVALSTSAGEIMDRGLCTYYADEPARSVSCGFTIRGSSSYGFDVPSYDHGRALVIDPLLWATYLGGLGFDDLTRIHMSPDGNPIVSANTISTDFPTTSGSYQVVKGADFDVAVTELSSDGSSVLWSTFIGGDGFDDVFGIDVGPSGTIYTVGDTNSTDFPVTAGAIKSHVTGEAADGFFLRLSATGDALLSSSLMGGSDRDLILDLQLEDDGSLFVMGETSSVDFPTTEGAAQTALGGGQDMFIGKLNATLTSLDYSTYYGGPSDEWGELNSVDGSGRAYVSGAEYGTGLPTTTGALQDTFSGGISDAFIARVNQDGSAFDFSTLLGGKGEDIVLDTAVDRDGTILLTGYTYSTDFPYVTGGYQPSMMDASSCGFLLRMSPDGKAILNSTYMGDSGETFGEMIAVDSASGVLVCGATSSVDFPNTTDAIQHGYAGGMFDGFLIKLTKDFESVNYSTYIGGKDLELMYLLEDVSIWTVYVAGYTMSDDIPSTADCYQPNLAGASDGYLAKISFDLEDPVAVAGPDLEIDQHESAAFNGTASSDNDAVVNWTWSFVYEARNVSLYGERARFTFDTVGRYPVTLAVRDPAGRSAKATMNVTVLDITPPQVEAGKDVEIDQHGSVAFNGTATDNVVVVDYNWTFVYLGQNVSLAGQRPTFTFDEAGTYEVTLTVADAAGNRATAKFNVTVRDITPPLADAGGDLTVDQHQVARLNGTGSTDNVGVVNWTWRFGYNGGQVALEGPTATFVFDIAGVYVVDLTVRDAAGATASDALTVTVKDVTAPTADAGTDTTVDQHATVNLNGTGSDDNVGVALYKWTFTYGGTAVNLLGASASYTFDEPGVYQVTLDVTDAAGNTAQDRLIVTVRDTTVPMAAAGPDIVVDQHERVTFDASGSSDNVGIARYVWTFKYGSQDVVLEGVNPSFAFDDAGTYDVALAVEDAAGNRATDHLTVTVRDVTPPVAKAGNDVTVDQHATVTLDGSGSTDNMGVTSWEWRFVYDGQSQVLVGRTQAFRFDAAGTYEVALNVTDAAGNRAMDRVVVTVRDTTVPLVAKLSNVTVGEGEKVTIDASASSDNVDIVKWNWTFSEGGRKVELSGPMMEHRFNRPGHYVITLTVADAAGNTATGSVTVDVGQGWTIWYTIVAAIIVVSVVVAVAWMVLHRRK